ncbi:MAG TPA: GIY-YIG nuclease family protein [Chlorobaculum sp.]|nr:GIY-YIG nuclease family protein [Chlorobaculum sp.]
MPEIVYVLINEAMPGIVKIGRTIDNVESRIVQLSSSSGVPLAFECYFAAEVQNCANLERKLHQLFSENRVNPKREFFKIDPERVVLAISIGAFKEVTVGTTQIDKEEQEALEKAKSRRPRLRLDALGIKPGEILTLSRDESITAEVVEGGRVLFNGLVQSLSAAALTALQSLGYKTSAASGSDYWKYDGELLDERRRRMESEQFDQVDLFS